MEIWRLAIGLQRYNDSGGINGRGLCPVSERFRKVIASSD